METGTPAARIIKTLLFQISIVAMAKDQGDYARMSLVRILGEYKKNADNQTTIHRLGMLLENLHNPLDVNDML